jgi:type I restriction enzyme R subunit
VYNRHDHTDNALNCFSSKDISKKFDSDEYKILVVANKFLTGFDQPKLTTMYVDKKLQGVLAVQALSRLNRSADKLGKKTEDLFVLDFFNEIEDIQNSFNPFYTATTLSGATDVNVLHDLKDFLDSLGIYEWKEVEKFIEKYFNKDDASELSPIIDIASHRFNDELELEDKEKIDYKIKAKQFVKIYGQMASIMLCEVEDWEKLFWFLKFLIPKLIIQDKNQDVLDDLLNSVDLSTYGLERTKLNVISLDDNETELKPQNPNPRGVFDDEDKNYLDTIINSFNEKWFQGWEATPEEQRIRFINIVNKIKEHPDFKNKYANNPDTHTKNLAYQEIFKDIMSKQRQSELELYKKIHKDNVFKNAFQDTIKRILSM